MSDIIQLLPDHIANQIAAGEVVQRPASAVKELLENALDAGADKIQLIVRDAGKALIQVIDNGSGMSAGDAKLCFARHATSKLRQAEDLFAIRTMGFRGEAMASIAAIAQVELKTKTAAAELGTLIRIEGSVFVAEEPVSCQQGTQISVKNLFFNTPARRNFLKSNSAEMKHILDEFQRVALAHPEIAWSLHSDGQEVYRLPVSTLKQRIVHLFGNNYNERLIPVEEQTTIINLKGFIGKPQFAKKTRGEQFFFVNNRFIKDAYLNHAILKAYEEILPDDHYPFYVLFIEIDPAQVDVNVHPTKTEIKYIDEKSIYAILHAAIKRSIGRFNISPSIDFNQETGFAQLITPKPVEDIVPPSISFNPDFNPFAAEQKPKRDTDYSGFNARMSPSTAGWEDLYQINTKTNTVRQESIAWEEPVKEETRPKPYMQWHQRYIVSQIKSGIMIIDQQAAHERVLYEKFLQHLEDRKGASQQSLFPQTITLSANDFVLVQGLFEDIRSLGFQVREFGKNTLVIEGIPVDIGSTQINESELFEQLIENYKQNLQALKLDKRESLAKSMAKNAAIKAGQHLSQEEMNVLVDELFACKDPNFSLNGKWVVQTLSLSEIAQKFEKN